MWISAYTVVYVLSGPPSDLQRNLKQFLAGKLFKPLFHLPSEARCSHGHERSSNVSGFEILSTRSGEALLRGSSSTKLMLIERRSP